MIEVTSSSTPHCLFKNAGTIATIAPSKAAAASAAIECNPAGSFQAIPTIVAPIAPIKKEPSAIMENCPDLKIMITARAVNISGEAASTILPIRRIDSNGPTKTL